MRQFPDSSSFRNLKNSKYIYKTVGDHDSVAVARQGILQQPEVQRKNQTVGNLETVAR
jgi:hypothetical protein